MIINTRRLSMTMVFSWDEPREPPANRHNGPGEIYQRNFIGIESRYK